MVFITIQTMGNTPLWTLDGCPCLTPEQIEQAKAQMANSWRVDDKPYPTWALSNNNAEIRRVKERIASLTQRGDTAFVGWEFDGVRWSVTGMITV